VHQAGHGVRCVVDGDDAVDVTPALEDKTKSD
jgi:hypothetical protein